MQVCVWSSDLPFEFPTCHSKVCLTSAFGCPFPPDPLILLGTITPNIKWFFQTISYLSIQSQVLHPFSLLLPPEFTLLPSFSSDYFLKSKPRSLFLLSPSTARHFGKGSTSACPCDSNPVKSFCPVQWRSRDTHMTSYLTFSLG